MPTRVSEFQDYFSFAQQNFHARFPASQIGNHLIERAGVGVALSLMNHILGLHEADWARIMNGRIAAMDFRSPAFEGRMVASDGERIVEVEAKGSVTENPSAIGSSISDHRRSIEHKKEVQRQERNPNTLVGVITAIPTRSSIRPICRLLDPPIEIDIEDPWKFRLMARLSFYLSELLPISRIRMLTALSNRLLVLSRTRSYRDLDGVPLVADTSESFTVSAWLSDYSTMVGNSEIFGWPSH